MNRVLVTLLVGALLVGVVPAAATLTDTDDDSEPGATFAGVIGVQRAEVGNEVAQRSLDHRLESARSDRSKAAVVASETTQLSERLDQLERKKARLKTALENGSIGRGEYQARLAQLAAEIRSVERRANTTAEVASTLPTETLNEKGVDRGEVRSVARRANEAGDGAVSEAASQVAGGRVGNGLGDVPPGQQRKDGNDDSNRGKPDNPGQGNGQDGTTTHTDSKPSGPPSNNGQGEGANECRGNQNCTDDQQPGNDGNETGQSGSNGNDNTTNPGNGAGDGNNASNGNGADDGNGADNGNNADNGADNGNGSDNGNGQAGPDDPTPTPTDTDPTVDDTGLAAE